MVEIIWQIVRLTESNKKSNTKIKLKQQQNQIEIIIIVNVLKKKTFMYINMWIDKKF